MDGPSAAPHSTVQPMPAGTYFGLVGNLRPGKAGLTSAMLQRYRLINERFAKCGDPRRMTLLTFSEHDKDDVEAYGLTDGVDVLNVERHGRRLKGSAGWVEWLRELVSDATADVPIYLICDGHHVGAVVVEELRRLPHVHFIQVVHNPTTSAKYSAFRASAMHFSAIVCATERQAVALRSDRHHGGTGCGGTEIRSISYPRRDAPVEPAERNARRIVMLTRVHWQKDIRLAVEAFQQLDILAQRFRLEHGKSLVLDIYGALESSTEVARARRAIDAFGLEGKVTLHGHVPGAFDQLGSSSITWLTSRFEGWGLAITEAQQSGCIPIVVDEPFGPSEQVQNGKNGILVRSRAAQWLRHEEDRKQAAIGRRLLRRVGRRFITPLSVQVARRTLQVLEMDAADLDSMRRSAMAVTESHARSPQAYIDNWIRLIEDVELRSHRG